MKKTLPWLSDVVPSFPPVETAFTEPDGLLAAGGNLDKKTILTAYQQGIFPWFSEGEPILWWSPNPRMVLKPDDLKISKSLGKLLRKNCFKVTFDQAFSDVISGCSKPRPYAEGTWITGAMKQAYCNLYDEGYGHSVEVWDNGELVGGLYGVAIGRVFFGESMFSRKNNASKVAFAWLCHHLNRWKFQLIDCQVYTPHLQTLGAQTIPRAEFIQRLDCYCPEKASGANWKAERQWNDQSP